MLIALVTGALFTVQSSYSTKLNICRMYASLANFYSIQTKLFIGQPRMSCSHSISRSPELLMNGPVDELVGAAEEVSIFSWSFLFLARMAFCKDLQ